MKDRIARALKTVRDLAIWGFFTLKLKCKELLTAAGVALSATGAALAAIVSALRPLFAGLRAWWRRKDPFPALRERWRAWAPTCRQRRRWGAFVCLFLGLAWAWTGWLVTEQSAGKAFAALGRGAFWYTAVFLGAWTGLGWLVTRRLGPAAAVPGVLTLGLTLVSHFKVHITSTPLTLGDLSLVGQVGNIAKLNRSSLVWSASCIAAVVLTVLLVAAVLPLSRKLRLPRREAARWAGVPAAVLLCVFWLGSDALVYTPLGAPGDTLMSQREINSLCGVPLGLWRGLSAARGQGEGELSEEYMERVLAQTREYVAQEAAAGGKRAPNIILILSESFFDPTVLPGVEFDADPVPEFHALQAESVSGNFYTHALGFGTSNVELTMLTGMNTGLSSGDNLFSWDPEVFSRLPAVPELLRREGYYTSLVHVYNDSIYHRRELFRTLGFDDMYFDGDLAAIYPPARDPEALSGRISGTFYSDELLTDVLVSQYELAQAEGTGPVFLYGSSMENHTPYAGKYGPEELTVSLQTSLTGEERDVLVNVCQGLSNASRALGKLVDHFRSAEEPLVILFFGDHRPGLGTGDGGSVYAGLGDLPQDTAQWSEDDHRRAYATDYLIWSNDPSYLPGSPGQRRDSSCDYFGSLLLDVAQAERPLYWKLIGKLSRLRLVDCLDLHMDAQGNTQLHLPKTGEDGRGLSLLRALIQDAVFGRQYAAAAAGGE